MSTVYQHSTGIAQTQFDNIVTEVTTRMQFEETTESARAHTGKTSNIGETDFVAIMGIDIVLDFQYPTAVTGYLDLGITACSKRTSPGAKREFVEDTEELRKRIKSVLDRAEFAEHRIDLHNSIHGKAESFLGFVHHPLQ